MLRAAGTTGVLLVFAQPNCVECLFLHVNGEFWCFNTGSNVYEFVCVSEGVLLMGTYVLDQSCVFLSK